MTLNGYDTITKQSINNSEVNSVLDMYLSGVAHTFQLFNSLNEGKFYCIPPKLSLDKSMIIQSIEVGRNTEVFSLGTKKFNSNEMGIEGVAFLGLKEIFPCRE